MTLATVTPLPVEPQAVEKLLDDMAGRDAPLIEVAPYACESLTAEELALAWDDFRRAVMDRDGLATGMVTWPEVYPDLECSGRQETALQMACAAVDDARRYLLEGAL